MTSFFVQPVEDLAYHLVQLAESRKTKDDVEKRFKRLKAQLQAEMDAKLSDLSDELAQAKVQEGVCRAEVEKLALKKYTATGEKKVHPAVSIRDMTTLDYDPDKALDYARQHLPNAVKLDAAKFKRAALALDLDFVSIATEPKCYISSDLSEWTA